MCNYFSADETKAVKRCRAACYISNNPLDTASDWSCTECGHVIGNERIRDLEEMALKIVTSGMQPFILYACSQYFSLYG